MPPSVTDQQLAEEIRQTNKRLDDAIATLRAEGSALREKLTTIQAELKVEMQGITGGLKVELESIRGDIKAEIGKINNSLGWMKALTGAATGIIGLSLTGVALMIYQAGQRDARIELGVASLQKVTEEIRADLKARDKSMSDSLEGMRKSDDEIRIVVKGLGSDMTGLRSSFDHMNEIVSRLPVRPR